MKNSGIIRKVDDLGRIVIPKEIRNSLFIKEGSPMDISVSEDLEIILRKCNMLESIADISEKYASVLFEVLGHPILMTDEEKVVCCVGLSKKQYLSKELSDQLKNSIHNSVSYTASNEFQTTLVPITKGEEIKFNSQLIVPISLDGRCIGLIILLNFENSATNVDLKTVLTVSKLISNHLSNQ